MSDIVTIIHDIQTGEVIQKVLNTDEAESFEALRAEQNAYIAEKKAELEAKAEQKAAILERLGLTEEELKVVLS